MQIRDAKIFKCLHCLHKIILTGRLMEPFLLSEVEYGQGQGSELAPLQSIKTCNHTQPTKLPLLTVDPTKNVCLSYDDEDHEFVRAAIIASHVGDPLSVKEAIAKLQDAWKKTNKKKVTQWNNNWWRNYRGGRMKHDKLKKKYRAKTSTTGEGRGREEEGDQEEKNQNKQF